MAGAEDGNERARSLKLPVCARPNPYIINVKAGEDYLWCSCGLSKSQPWCDGSHAGTGFEPIAFTAPIDGEFYMCGCKRSDNPPYCFGNCRGHDRPAKQEQWKI